MEIEMIEEGKLDNKVNPLKVSRSCVTCRSRVQETCWYVICCSVLLTALLISLPLNGIDLTPEKWDVSQR